MYLSGCIGPFKIKREVHLDVYHLDLPSYLKLHPIFHVSLIKPYQAHDEATRAQKVHLASDFEVWDRTVGNIKEIIVHREHER